MNKLNLFFLNIRAPKVELNKEEKVILSAILRYLIENPGDFPVEKYGLDQDELKNIYTKLIR